MPELTRHSLAKPGLGCVWVPALAKVIPQYQHRHVAPDAIGILAYALQVRDLSQPELLRGIVELGGVAPGWKIRVSAVRNYFAGRMKVVVPGVLFPHIGIAADNQSRVLTYPGTIQTHVVWNEIQQDSKPGAAGSAEKIQICSAPSQLRTEFVVRYRKRRSFKIIRDDPRYRLAARPYPPRSHQPNGVETKPGELSEPVRRNLVAPPALGPRIYFIESQAFSHVSMNPTLSGARRTSKPSRFFAGLSSKGGGKTRYATR